MDFILQQDTPEISAFRKEVREWLAQNMKGSEHLRWSGNWSTRENDEIGHPTTARVSSRLANDRRNFRLLPGPPDDGAHERGHEDDRSALPHAPAPMRLRLRATRDQL